ncbi:MAG: hypothetical protein ABR591_07835 [Candidatus Velthaea sp.]
MSVVQPPKPDVIDDRLASLEDPLLAQRLIAENPALFGDEPPQTQRQVLAWATRRFGTAVIAVTAAVSVALGYVFTGAAMKHDAPAPAAKAAPAVRAPAVPLTHRRAQQHAAPPRVQHAATVAPVPVVRHHAAAVVAPAVNHEDAVLRARLRAQEVELAHLRRQAALEEHAARRAQARAAAALTLAHQRAQTVAARPQAAPRTEPLPQTQRRERTAPGTAPAASADPANASANAPVDVPAPGTDAGTKAPVNPNGGWNEHPPIGGTFGIPGPVPIGGTPRDACTPRGGRTGIVNQIIEAAASRAVSGMRF